MKSKNKTNVLVFKSVKSLMLDNGLKFDSNHIVFDRGNNDLDFSNVDKFVYDLLYASFQTLNDVCAVHDDDIFLHRYAARNINKNTTLDGFFQENKNFLSDPKKRLSRPTLQNYETIDFSIKPNYDKSDFINEKYNLSNNNKTLLYSVAKASSNDFYVSLYQVLQKNIFDSKVKPKTMQLSTNGDEKPKIVNSPIFYIDAIEFSQPVIEKKVNKKLLNKNSVIQSYYTRNNLFDKPIVIDYLVNAVGQNLSLFNKTI